MAPSDGFRNATEKSNYAAQKSFLSPDNVVKNLQWSVNHNGTNLESALIAAGGKSLGFCFLSAQYMANLSQVCK